MANVYNQIFAGAMLVLGAILVLIAWKINPSLCKDKSLESYNKTVLCLGTVLVSFSLAYFGFSSGETSSDLSIDMYIIAMAVLGVVLLILGIMMNSKVKDCSSAKNASLIWIIGLALVAASLSYFYYDKHMSKQ